MKKIGLLLICFIIAFPSSARGLSDTVVILSQKPSGNPTRIEEPVPIVTYNNVGVLTIDFRSSQVDNFVVTISSPYTDVDYYATSSFTTIPIIVDGISDYSIVIETADGDVFEGVLAASEYASSQMY